MLYIDTLGIPKDLILLLACLFFGALHSRNQQQVPGFEGVRAVAVSVAIGWMTGWILLTHTALHISLISAIGSFLSFLGTAVQLALVKGGDALLDNPAPLLHFLRQILPPVLAKFLPDDTNPPYKQP